MELRKKRIPYVVLGGESFFDRKEVKDLTCYLRAGLSPDEDTAILRILNRPRRGIGDATIDQLRTRAAEKGRSIWSVLTDAQFLDALNPKTAKAVAGFVHLIGDLGVRFAGGAAPSALLRQLVQQCNYEAEIERSSLTHEEREMRWNLVEEMVSGLAAMEGERDGSFDLAGFLDEVALGERDFGNDKDKQLKRNAVVLMTCHSAKGLEFPHVYMPGVEEYRMPHHRSALDTRAIEEERRLFYVGVTRTQDTLTFSFALSRMKWGKPRATHPSRFLLEAIGQPEKASAIASAVTHELTAPKGARRRDASSSAGKNTKIPGARTK